MNEAGVFGRFVPDFGRVVAQMQFDMYHHYTVDEHSIRAIGLLSRDREGPSSRTTIRSATSILRPDCLQRRVALCRGAAPRHCQGARRRSLRSWVPKWRGAAVPAAGAERGRDRDGGVAGALASAHVGHGVQARPRRLQDDPRLRAGRADAPSACACCSCSPSSTSARSGPACGTAGNASCSPSCMTLPRKCCASATSSSGRERADRRPRRRLRRRCSACDDKRFAALSGRFPRATGSPSRSRCIAANAAPDPGGGRRAASYRGAGSRCRARRDAGDGLCRRSSGAVLSHRRRHPSRRRQHHRRAHPHHARRPGARQFPRPGPARPARSPRRARLDRLKARDRRCARQSSQIAADQLEAARAAAHARRGASRSRPTS